MKTTGLTLQEALQALVDGKCRAAKHPMLMHEIYVCDTGMPSLVWMGVDGEEHPFRVMTCVFTPEWSLIDPVQEYEEVEVVRWAVLTRDGYIIRYLKSQPESDYCIKNTGIRIIKMTGIDRVPKKEKVTRRVDVEASVTQRGDVLRNYPFVDHPETHGKTGKLIFEWEE